LTWMKRADISRLFLWGIVFYALVYGLTFLLGVTFAGQIVGECNSNSPVLTSPDVQPGTFAVVAVIFNTLGWFLTAGLSTTCGFPAGLAWLIGIANGILQLSFIIGLVFYIRGSS
jgi:hypothetical protein